MGQRHLRNSTVGRGDGAQTSREKSKITASERACGQVNVGNLPVGVNPRVGAASDDELRQISKPQDGRKGRGNLASDGTLPGLGCPTVKVRAVVVDRQPTTNEPALRGARDGFVEGILTQA